MDRRRTEIIRRRYDRVALIYDLMEGPGGVMNRWRRALWSRASGRVLEVGVGTGRNMPYYPPGVQVTAIDFSPRMLERARKRAARLGLGVDLRLMDAQQMDFPDGSFDTVVTTCVFCSVPDPVLGLREVRRVCRPDGQVLLLEHVRSRMPLVGELLDILNPITTLLIGVNINRDTVGNIRRAGLVIVEEKDLWLDILKEIVARPAGEGGEDAGR